MARIVSVSVETITSRTADQACRLVAQAFVGGIFPIAPNAALRTQRAIRGEGGWIVRDTATGQIITAGAQPVSSIDQLGRVNFTIELPACEIAYENLGLICLLRLMALVSALHEVGPENPLGSIRFAFRGDRPPSIEAIQEFGLCLMAARPNRVPAVLHRDVTYIQMDLDWLPEICAAALPKVGQSQVMTSDKGGRVKVAQGSTGTLCSPSRIALIRSLAEGHLSLIGLADRTRPKRA